METESAWDDINPTRTALVRQPGLQSTSLARHRLEAATTDLFRTELTACLALVAPSGMTQDARNEWLRAAWGTLQGIPADLLKTGCYVARQTADHPAKIVPAIMGEIKETWDRRRRAESEDRRAALPKPDPEFRDEDRCTPEEAAKILAEFGLKRNPLDWVE